MVLLLCKKQWGWNGFASVLKYFAVLFGIGISKKFFGIISKSFGVKVWLLGICLLILECGGLKNKNRLLRSTSIMGASLDKVRDLELRFGREGGLRCAEEVFAVRGSLRGRAYCDFVRFWTEVIVGLKNR